MSWETLIGLEVHLQLKTRSKMFCPCSADFGAPPNTNVCPVCLGLPGSLPVPNESAVRLGVRAALALGCTIHDTSEFARKNYFYPDLPKGYQISQFDKPLATGGWVDVGTPEEPRPIRITRLHLEEDAGKSFHGRIPGKTAVDFNRCGVPLLEIVSEPDIRSLEEARSYLVALKQILEYLEVSDCNMEQGSLRVDANLSVRRTGEARGTKQEVKNMNSFAATVRALGQLRVLQIDTLENGGRVELTTYTAAAAELRAMRTKEESHDYRYFPDPDLPPLVLSQCGIDVVDQRRHLGELPQVKRQRFRTQYLLSEYDAGVLSSTRDLADYFEAVMAGGADSKTVANWVMGPVLADANENDGRYRVSPGRLAALIALVTNGTVSNRAAKKVFAAVAERGGEPGAAAQRLGLVQVSDTNQLANWIDTVLESNAGEAARYRSGEGKLMQFLMGQVMKQSRGKADPKLVQQLLRERLGR